jgi:hypothetical protein
MHVINKTLNNGPKYFLTGRQKLLQKGITELQSNKHVIDCWLGKYETNLRNEQLIHNHKSVKKQGIWNEFKGYTTLTCIYYP